jgi:dynein intermediate chain
MDRRKEELEKKRQKLAELRRAREERRALLESQSTQSSSVSFIFAGNNAEFYSSRKIDNHYNF